MGLLLIIILVLVLFGGFGSYTTFNHPNYGPAWGSGIGVGTVILIVLIVLLLRGRI